MDKIKLDRISELYKKSKGEGLTEAEKQEQQELRAEYLESVRRNFKNTLDSIRYED